MAPSQPAGVIKINVPRLNSAVITKPLTTEVESVAKSQRTKVDLKEIIEPSSSLALAIESASEWNSLLMTARAERGPQWDIGTQQFMVDVDSELYYDPSLLTQKEAKSEPPQTPTQFPGEGGQPGPHALRNPHQQQQHSQMRDQYHPSQYNNVPMPPQAGPSHHMPPMMNTSYSGGSPYGNQIPSNQFYGENSGSPVNMRMAMGGHQQPPQEGRRVTRAMADDASYHGM